MFVVKKKQTIKLYTVCGNPNQYMPDVQGELECGGPV